jgi:hypothetical protein
MTTTATPVAALCIPCNKITQCSGLYVGVKERGGGAGHFAIWVNHQSAHVWPGVPFGPINNPFLWRPLERTMHRPGALTTPGKRIFILYAGRKL